MKVIVLATSKKTRGGITSVVNLHSNTKLWYNYNCKWIETHIDRNIFLKIFFFFRALILFIFHIKTTDIIHVHLSGKISVYRKLIFIKLGNFLQKKIIIHFHAFSENSKIDKKSVKLYKKVFNYSDTILVLSESWKKNIINDLNICKKKVQVLYNPCIPNTEIREIAKENIILYAGTLNKRKNYSTLIKAFAMINKKYPNWKLVFAGNGELNSANELAHKLDVAKQTLFLGWINGHVKNEYFSKSRIFCLPSFAEGFPMAVLDAFSYGLPVITTPVGGLPDVAIHNKNMLLFDPNDVNSLSEHIELLINNEDKRDLLSEESFKLSSSTFSLSEIEIQLNNIYNQWSY
ncbi:glycosyltransferase family 4 protein [Flammeovirga aprica]|uniref:Glycosyltransferase family 4 protein n=1 Tax=Flammeovirga aprica JL-4 TaxID=694437 RepID=A0A7X9XCV1_9BACT|nr:glycosyltransferase family 4 protein [Flammeovirga aprica]NME72221.1 glycosyltransferase family 4 protein [Flammeovirga aprica JL-4]